ncbi:MAG: YgiT-type zinc finger protein [Nitrospinae bacterium]|nr:YgiT-type zinc finger protein [Nitrospinota bacterium]
MKICHFCGNKNFKNIEVQYTYKQNDQFLIVDDVPCEQCEYCGEQYFKGKVLKQIEKEFNSIHLHGKKVKKEIIVPVEQFHEIQS